MFNSSQLLPCVMVGTHSFKNLFFRFLLGKQKTIFYMPLIDVVKKPSKKQLFKNVL